MMVDFKLDLSLYGLLYSLHKIVSSDLQNNVL